MIMQKSTATLIDNKLLDEITEQAKKSPRLRMNLNLHDSYESNAQKMINSLEPGTVIPVHRHRNFSETYIVLRGAIKVFFYDNNKILTDSYLLDPCDGYYGLEIPAGVFHSLEVIAHGTAIFEAKDGPYVPIGADDIL